MEEEALLRKLKGEGLALNEIAARLERTSAGVDVKWHAIRDRTDPDEMPRSYHRKK